MLGLGVKVHADTSELIAAESRITHFADHFERVFLRKFSHMAGAGGLAIGAISLIEGIFGKPEEIDELARKFSFTTDEVQLLQKAAKEAGVTFEEFIERAKKGAVDLGEVLKKTRSEGGVGISSGDIKTLVEGKKILSGAWNKIQNFLIHGAATALTYDWGSGLRGEIDRDAEKRWGWTGGVGHFGTPPESKGVKNITRLAAIKAELDRIRLQKQGLRDQDQMELTGGQLTGRQAIGAYTSQTGGMVSKLNEIERAIRDLNKTEEALLEEQRTLNNGP